MPIGAYVLGLERLDRTQVALVGGKAAHLGELSRIADLHVPPGFCVTTHGFRRMLSEARSSGGELRRTLETIAVPDELATAISDALGRLGDGHAYAVRSSATVEDSAIASYAGLFDTYLDVVGRAAVLEHVRRCWASVFSERAVAYRLQRGLDARNVDMAVVVQRMVTARAAGVLFTADPVSSNRTVACIEACVGSGEALVSGRTNPDVYRVRDGAIVSREQRQPERTLTDAQVSELAQLGRRIEAHFGSPQDIEWCLGDDGFAIVQSRPITTLFPIPAAADEEPRVYVSVGHQQMMTDAMKPLGLSLFRLTTRAPMVEAGGRLFVDVTKTLASPTRRVALLELIGRSEPRMADALRTVVERDFVPAQPDDGPAPVQATIDPDPAIVAELIARSEASIAAAKRDIEKKSGAALFDFILADLEELKRVLFDPRSHRVIMAAMEAAWWLDDHLRAWLGEKGAADALARSLPNDVTAEMSLALLDVADVVRAHPDVVAFLRQARDDAFLDALPELAGGREARAAIVAYLEQYGMRGVGEIDVTRPRWSENPSALLPMLLADVDHFAPGERRRRVERGREEARQKEHELLERLRRLPDGERKAEETRRNIDCVRSLLGYREYPKYAIIHRYFIYKQALLREAERLVRAGVLRAREDIFFFTFQELHDVVRTNRGDRALLRQRKEAFDSHRALVPPRVLTSDGEALTGAIRRDDVPTGALVGVAVSGGIVEGRARVVTDPSQADLEPDDILVTVYTDPSWTPLFVAIRGLVTEVGGLMTHGAVTARELGVPAVVGVEHATRRIRDGQRIRVHGTDGYVELLDAE